jgi:deoxyribonuclease-4
MAFTGVHVSIQGGLSTAIDRGTALDCSAIQIFTHSSRTWAFPPVPDAEVDRFRDVHSRSGIGPVLVHASYLINTATADPTLHEKSIEALKQDWLLSNALGVSGLVLHPGSSAGQTVEDAIRRSAELIGEVMVRVPEGQTRLLLENTAGGGKTLGRSPDELSAIFEAVGNTDRIGLCLDSCHLLAAGYEIRTDEGYERVLDAFLSVVPEGRPGAWHVNDAIFPIGSGRDRHTHIGKGHIGPGFFWRLLHDPRFDACPMILETPKGETDREDRLNLSVVSILTGQKRFDEKDTALDSALKSLEDPSK